MKKILDFIKPFLFIILGALLLLIYLNSLQLQDAQLAMGIVGIVVAVYYLGLGIVVAILGDKLPASLRGILDLVAICLYPVFGFVGDLLNVIDYHDMFGPTGWVIVILSMVASLAAAALYVVAYFVKGKLLVRLAQLAAMVFVLTLVLDIVFDFAGGVTILGNIPLVVIAVYACYGFELFKAVSALSAEKEAPKAKPEEAAEPVEEPAEEPSEPVEQ